MTTHHVVRQARWSKWHDSCFAELLSEEVRAAEAKGLSFVAIEDHAAGQPRPWTQSTFKKVQRSFQKTCSLLLDSPATVLREIRLREKLQRWPLSIFPRCRASRAALVIDTLAKLVPPRVMAAVLRTWFNGWCTDRRFQKRGARNRGCIWGCRVEDGDSLEHYSVCPVIREFGVSTLRLPSAADSPTRRAEFFMLTPGVSKNPLVLQRAALRLTVAYRTHNITRNRVDVTDRLAKEMLQQSLVEVSRADPRLARVVESVWARPATDGHQRADASVVAV